ncbi:MAG: MerR family transcriptional regulator [Neisseria sp.]|nr:MerR family transcriptional regulator [Neisseria sp.]
MQTFFKKTELSKRTGLGIETLRYYEKVGLLPEPIRAANGYRLFTEEAVATLQFIKKCRLLGFSIEDTKQLLQLRDQTLNHNADELVRQQKAAVQEKIRQLQEIQAMLEAISDCTQTENSECKALNALNQ